MRDLFYLYVNPLKRQSPLLSSALSSACDFKSHFCKQWWTQIRLLLEQSDLGPHCLPVCKTRFEKSARIFSRRHKQTTFSDAVFLGALRVKCPKITNSLFHTFCLNFAFYNLWNDKHWRPRAGCSFRSSLIWVCTVFTYKIVRNFGVRTFRTFTFHAYDTLTYMNRIVRKCTF